jgi:hypothetical protein
MDRLRLNRAVKGIESPRTQLDLSDELIDCLELSDNPMLAKERSS